MFNDSAHQEVSVRLIGPKPFALWFDLAYVHADSERLDIDQDCLQFPAMPNSFGGIDRLLDGRRHVSAPISRVVLHNLNSAVA